MNPLRHLLLVATLVFAQLRVTLRGRAPIPGLEALFHPSVLDLPDLG